MNVVGDVGPVVDAGSEGVSLEPEAAGEVGTEVSEMQGGVDFGVEGWPGVVFEPLSGAVAA